VPLAPRITDLRKPDGTPNRCHCHMFHDTFAAEMLLAGVPIDQVSILLGYASVRVTKKHDSPWFALARISLKRACSRHGNCCRSTKRYQAEIELCLCKEPLDTAVQR
jgi:hypothetical protein